MRLNKWGAAAFASVLVVASVVLRTGNLAGGGSASTEGDATGFALLIPLLLGLPAAWLRLSPVQRRALWTVALWQLAYELVIRAGVIYARSATVGFDPQQLSRPLTYLGGTVCLLVAIRVGQGRAPRTVPEPAGPFRPD